MPKRPSSLSGIEAEHHIVGIRLRVIGEGNLRLALLGLNDIQRLELKPLPLATTNRFEPMVLSNFQSQRVRLELKTTEIDERMEVGRIIIFAKPVASEYPI